MFKESITEQCERVHGKEAVEAWKPCRKHRRKTIVMVVLCVACLDNLYRRKEQTSGQR
jgi:hypothetical protein